MNDCYRILWKSVLERRTPWTGRTRPSGDLEILESPGLNINGGLHGRNGGGNCHASV